MDGSYEYDLILYVANWPSPRHNAWDTLLQARAMENLSYCVGVNRTGKDANGLVYNGGSAIIDYLGKPLNIPGLTPEIITASIGLTQLRSFRDKFPTGMDADSFILKQ
jgi:predicted amidohydrolase